MEEEVCGWCGGSGSGGLAGWRVECGGRRAGAGGAGPPLPWYLASQPWDQHSSTAARHSQTSCWPQSALATTEHQTSAQ